MLEIRLVNSLATDQLAEFFRSLRMAGGEAQFHPHPLDDKTARSLVTYRGRDLYFGLLVGGVLKGYGILRGWDEGFEVPSLGIALLPSARGLGLGALLMTFLHSAARLRGALAVRLTVRDDNTSALKLYRSFGYSLEPLENGRLIGRLTL